MTQTVTIMTTTNDYLAALRRYKTDNASRLGIRNIGLFGSVARGEHNEESDVDVFVDMAEPDYFIVCDIHSDLERLLGRKVDLVTLHPWMRPLFKQNIEKDAIMA